MADCGVNAILTESDSYEHSALDATHKAGLRFFAGVACFSDHASNFHSLNKRPELWPVLENGERRPLMEWYVGMSPTDRRRQEEVLAEIKSIARTYPVDGVFLDFARWPLHWEIELGLGEGGRSIRLSIRRRWRSLRRRQGRFPGVSIRHQRKPLGSGGIDSASGSNSNARS